MNKLIRKAQVLFSLLFAILAISGCAANNMATKGDKFPLMYEETPLTILIVPPMNETTAADAKIYYATTVQESLSYWGYYVMPYEITGRNNENGRHL